MPSLSPTCIALVKNFEGYRAEPLRLPNGQWLFGYGHVGLAPPAAAMTEDEAQKILKEDLEIVAASVRATVLVSITQCQFDALCCFAFSIGVSAFERSDVLRYLNAGHPIAAATALDSWRVSGAAGSGAVLDALVRRRAVEKSLFLYEGVRTPAPSALIRPEVDPAAAMLAVPIPPGGAPNEDETARKLRDILAKEPQTASTLQPAPEAEEVVRVVSAPPPSPKPQRDLIGYVALGVLGLLLIAMGVTGAGDDKGIAHIVFTAPGVIAAVMSAFYLLKSAAN